MYTDSGGSTFTSTLVIFLLFLRTIAAVQVGETRALPTAVWTGISLVTNDFELLFLCLLGHLCILFVYTFQRVLLILSSDCLSFFVDLQGVLRIYPGYETSITYKIGKCFPPSVVVFHFLVHLSC